jgi:hypothetical protein
MGFAVVFGVWGGLAALGFGLHFLSLLMGPVAACITAMLALSVALAWVLGGD